MRGGLCPLVLGCIVLTGSAGAQNPAPSDPGLDAATPQVLLELTVRDHKGRVVKALQPGDVEIYEDGVKRPLKGLRRVAAQQTGEPQARPPGTFALPEYELVCIVFHNLDLQTRKFATEAAREFLQNDLGPETYTALFSLGGRFAPLATFTNDRAKLIEAAGRVAAGTAGLGSSDSAALSANPIIASVGGAGRDTPGVLSVTGGELGQLAMGGADVSIDAGANAARGDAADQRRMFIGAEGRRQMAQMRQMVQQLGSLPGHKTVLLLSPGLTLSGDAAQLKSLLTAANRANIAIYAVDTLGLTQNSALQGAGNILSRASNVAISTAQLGQNAPMQQSKEQMRQFDNLTDATRIANTQGGLRALAEGTGGFLIATNDLKKSFARVLEELGTRYEAVYEPVSGALDGRMHKIEVKARPDLTVQSRTSYFALPKLKDAPLRDFEIPALAALSAKPQPHNFDFQAAAFRFRPEETASQYVVTFEVPASKLTVTPQPEHKEARLHMSVLGLLRNAQGSVVDRVSQDVVAGIPDDRMSALASETVSLARPIKLAPGHYTLDAVVVDHEGQKSSTTSLAFDNPRLEGRLNLSDIVLVQRLEKFSGQPDAADPLQLDNRRVVPQMIPELPGNRVPYLYFVVYPDKSKAEKTELTLQFLVDGRLVSEQTTEVSAPAGSPAIPVVLSGLSRPGRCELKVVASQGDESVERSFHYTVAGN
jgi:VWFA-related protein